MSKFANKKWSRLYRDETGDFLKLPTLARGLAAELLKIADWDTGIIDCDADLFAHVCLKLAVQRAERRTVSVYLQRLIDIRYVVFEDTHWRIRNYAEAQGRKPSKTKAEEPAESLADPESKTRQTHRTRTASAQKSEKCAQDEHQPQFVSGASARNDSEDALKSRVEERRVEESSVVGGTHAAPPPPVSERRPVEPPPTIPTDRQPSGPESARLLAELRQHPALASVATPDTSDVLAGRAIAAARRIDWVVEAVRECAADVTMARGNGETLPPSVLGKKLRTYCDRAKPPLPKPVDQSVDRSLPPTPIGAPLASKGPYVPPPADVLAELQSLRDGPVQGQPRAMGVRR